MVWMQYLIKCARCGHNNSPAPRPRDAVRLILLGQTGKCKQRRKKLRPTTALRETKLVRDVRAELKKEGLLK